MTRTPLTPAVTNPVDTDTMRGTIALLLPQEAVQPPAGAELATTTAKLRGHMELMISEVTEISARLPEDDIPRYCALACIGEARGKLSAAPALGPYGELSYARKMARTLTALCDHYEALTGQGMCVACDRPLRATDETITYSSLYDSAGTATSRIHAGCAQRPRPAL
ncbi:DUF6415 family natural product biosynthesis protein [Streptomyces sp. NPDC015171]|uniref:DUF6415 family natural product biosynthesis protein n=1 Tax=Streptomyces sp. NPDC015171 TaxID=3364945 RepID=UPI0036F922EF